MPPSTAEVDSILRTPKGLVKMLDWSLKDGNKAPPEYSYYSATNLDTGEILEGVIVRAHWYPPLIVNRDKYGFSVFVNEKHRVYAVDVAPLSPHRNNPRVGKGRRFEGQRIGGAHEHFWDAGGYGYAEPLPSGIEAAGMESAWSYFCEQANIVRNHQFTPPLTDESGQTSWL